MLKSFTRKWKSSCQGRKSSTPSMCNPLSLFQACVNSNLLVYREVESKQQLELAMRNLQMELRNLKSSSKQVRSPLYRRKEDKATENHTQVVLSITGFQRCLLFAESFTLDESSIFVRSPFDILHILSVLICDMRTACQCKRSVIHFLKFPFSISQHTFSIHTLFDKEMSRVIGCWFH